MPIGLHVKQYRCLDTERRVVDAWLERVGHRDDLWFEYALADESGLRLLVRRYLRDDRGSRYVVCDADGARVVASEQVEIIVSERPPVLRLLTEREQ